MNYSDSEFGSDDEDVEFGLYQQLYFEPNPQYETNQNDETSEISGKVQANTHKELNQPQEASRSSKSNTLEQVKATNVNSYKSNNIHNASKWSRKSQTRPLMLTPQIVQDSSSLGRESSLGSSSSKRSTDPSVGVKVAQSSTLSDKPSDGSLTTSSQMEGTTHGSQIERTTQESQDSGTSESVEPRPASNSVESQVSEGNENGQELNSNKSPVTAVLTEDSQLSRNTDIDSPQNSCASGSVILDAPDLSNNTDAYSEVLGDGPIQTLNTSKNADTTASNVSQEFIDVRVRPANVTIKASRARDSQVSRTETVSRPTQLSVSSANRNMNALRGSQISRMAQSRPFWYTWNSARNKNKEVPVFSPSQQRNIGGRRGRFANCRRLRGGVPLDNLYCTITVSDGSEDEIEAMNQNQRSGTGSTPRNVHLRGMGLRERKEMISRKRKRTVSNTRYQDDSRCVSLTSSHMHKRHKQNDSSISTGTSDDDESEIFILPPPPARQYETITIPSLSDDESRYVVSNDTRKKKTSSRMQNGLLPQGIEQPVVTEREEEPEAEATERPNNTEAETAATERLNSTEVETAAVTERPNSTEAETAAATERPYSTEDETTVATERLNSTDPATSAVTERSNTTEAEPGEIAVLAATERENNIEPETGEAEPLEATDRQKSTGAELRETEASASMDKRNVTTVETEEAETITAKKRTESTAVETEETDMTAATEMQNVTVAEAEEMEASPAKRRKKGITKKVKGRKSNAKEQRQKSSCETATATNSVDIEMINEVSVGVRTRRARILEEKAAAMETRQTNQSRAKKSRKTAKIGNTENPEAELTDKSVDTEKRNDDSGKKTRKSRITDDSMGASTEIDRRKQPKPKRKQKAAEMVAELFESRGDILGNNSVAEAKESDSDEEIDAIDLTAETNLSMSVDESLSRIMSESTSKNPPETTTHTLPRKESAQTKHQPYRKKPSCEHWSEEMAAFYDSDISEDLDVEEVLSNQTRSARYWHVHSADYANRSRRYFNQEDRCTRCRQFGHKVNACPRVPRCYLCSATDHTTRQKCPENCCFRCGKDPHHFCPDTALHVKCQLCGYTGHRTIACPDLWRRFHNTTSGEIPVTSSLTISKPPWERYCYNCARQGHFGPDCPQKYDHRFYVQLHQSVVSYSSPIIFRDGKWEPNLSVPKVQKVKENKNVVKIHLPSHWMAGRIIGEQGVTVKEIQRRSKASVQISTNDYDRRSNPQVSIYGDSVACQDAKDMVEVLAERKSTKGFEEFIHQIFSITNDPAILRLLEAKENRRQNDNTLFESQDSHWYVNFLKDLPCKRKPFMRTVKRNIQQLNKTYFDISPSVGILKRMWGKMKSNGELQPFELSVVQKHMNIVSQMLIGQEMYGDGKWIRKALWSMLSEVRSMHIDDYVPQEVQEKLARTLEKVYNPPLKMLKSLLGFAREYKLQMSTDGVDLQFHKRNKYAKVGKRSTAKKAAKKSRKSNPKLPLLGQEGISGHQAQARVTGKQRRKERSRAYKRKMKKKEKHRLQNV